MCVSVSFFYRLTSVAVLLFFFLGFCSILTIIFTFRERRERFVSFLRSMESRKDVSKLRFRDDEPIKGGRKNSAHFLCSFIFYKKKDYIFFNLLLLLKTKARNGK